MLQQNILATRDHTGSSGLPVTNGGGSELQEFAGESDLGVDAFGNPFCPHCWLSDRQCKLGTVITDFDGRVTIWVCRRCGVTCIENEGERP